MNFNRKMACYLLTLIVVLWVLQGSSIIDLTGTEIIGATIVAFTLIVQFFYRKKPKEEPPTQGGTE